MYKHLAVTAVLAFSWPSTLAAISFDGAVGKDLRKAIAGAGEPVPASPAVHAQAEPVKEWTIMVFVNGKNNLEKYAMIVAPSTIKPGTVSCPEKEYSSKS